MRSSTQVRTGRRVTPASTVSEKKQKSWVGQRRRRYEIRLLILNYKKTHPCVDCGESDFRCLDFDHRNPNEKLFEISNSVAVSRSLTAIEC